MKEHRQHDDGKVLLKVATGGGETSLECNIDNEHDEIVLSAILARVAMNNPNLRSILLGTIEILWHKAEYKDDTDEGIDVDRIIKDLEDDINKKDDGNESTDKQAS